jgi:hypothetical protein
MRKQRAGIVPAALAKGGVLERYDGRFERRQVDHCDRMRVRAVESARIEDERVADFLDRRDVGMAIADEIELARLDRLLKAASVVAMDERDPLAGDF